MLRTRVAVVRCEDYDQARVDAAVREAAGRCLPDGWPGLPPGSALVKPNVLAARPPEDAVDTHPAVLAAVILFLRESGFSDITVGDSSGGTGTRTDVTERAMEVSGLTGAALARGARVASFDREETVAVPNPRGPEHGALALARRAVEAECLVSVSKLKTHTLTLLTGAIKNLYGTVPGGAKREYHRRNPSVEAFAALLVDIAEALRPALHVVDAVVGMDGNGPSAGNPRPIGLIIAGVDPVAVDAVLAAIAGLDPLCVPATRLAAQRGLGTADLSEIDLIGVPLEQARVRGFRKPVGAGFIPHVPPALTRMALSLSVTRPAFIAGLCTRCNVCVESCPVDALRLGEERPEVVDELCIGCYCCHELCPSRAVTLEHRHWLGRGLFGETRRERRRRGHTDVKEGEEENPS